MNNYYRDRNLGEMFPESVGAVQQAPYVRPCQTRRLPDMASVFDRAATDEQLDEALRRGVTASVQTLSNPHPI